MPEKNTIRKKNYTLISLMNIDTAFLNKILAKQIQQHIKDKVEFMPGMQERFNIHRSLNIIKHFNRIKVKKLYDYLNRNRKSIHQR